MSIPWFRVDTSLRDHDKTLALLDDRAPAAIKYRALFSYVCAIGWSVDKETDGRIPSNALVYVHGTEATARLLVKYDLWHEEPPGYRIHNFAARQVTAATARTQREDRRAASARANCVRWHGPDCWIEGEGCSRD